MSGKQNNGGSTPKIALPSNEQDEIRRMTKQKRRKSGMTRTFTSESFQQGLEQDRINAKGVQMLDLLDAPMCSTSPAAHDTLRTCMVQYVTSFTDTSRAGFLTRHKTAKEQALKPLAGPIRVYAERQLERAFRQR